MLLRNVKENGNVQSTDACIIYIVTEILNEFYKCN